MKRKVWITALRRCAALVCVAALGTALFRCGIGQRLALAAAGLRRPEGALILLDQQMSAPPPGYEAPQSDRFEWAGDTTVLDLPTVAVPSVDLPAITMTAPPANKGDGGKLSERVMNTGDRSKGVAVTNRSGTVVDIAAALSRDLTVKWEDTDAPQVLILHTHTTEGYMTYEADYFNAADRHRTHDHTRNVCAVGDTVKRTLAAYGITAIHDTTVHDSPVYSGAYTRSAAVAESYLKKYPTIKIVLDLHRDSVMDGEVMIKPTATVEGKKAAQMMLITGVVSTDALPHPHWQENLTLAAHWQEALDKVSPDLMRPLNLTASRYNQHLSTGWVLVEMGAEGNTVEEAVYSAQILGRTLAELLG
ncbi:MAG: stage II sporulation protein P [Clostridia bacterium]|nr:stage II sporulation protein P [Clostridia bacterium]